MSHKTSQRTRDGAVNKLKHRIHDIEPLFEIDAGETFTVRDLTVENSHAFKSTLNLCKLLGALEVVDTDSYKRPGMTKTRRINVYQWNPQMRAKLSRYREQLAELPCGHKAHIYNSREVPENKLSCKYCAEDGEYPEYAKETVREVL